MKSTIYLWKEMSEHNQKNYGVKTMVMELRENNDSEFFFTAALPYNEFIDKKPYYMGWDLFPKTYPSAEKALNAAFRKGWKILLR